MPDGKCLALKHCPHPTPSTVSMKLCPPPEMCLSSNPITYGCGLTWKQGLCKCPQVKTRACWHRMELQILESQIQCQVSL